MVIEILDEHKLTKAFAQSTMMKRIEGVPKLTWEGR